MFFKSKKAKEEQTIPEMQRIDTIAENALKYFSDGMTLNTSNIETREQADEYVLNHLEEIQDRISKTSLKFSRVVIELKRRRNVIETSENEPYKSGKQEALSILDAHISRLEDAYVQVFHLVDKISPRTKSHYYTLSELANMRKTRTTATPMTNPLALPVGLRRRLNQEVIQGYMPADDVVEACKKKAPNVTPETVLKGICLGDYIGSAYEATSDYGEYDPDTPYDLYRNRFTDDSIMALAIYEAMTSVKRKEKDTVQQDILSGHAYALCVSAMKYYAKLLPLVGYGPKFYEWAVNDADNYRSWGNGGAMRSGTIGAFFNDVESVIRYAIISAYPTHSHKAGEQAAVVTAVCVWLANHGATKSEIRDYVYKVCDDIILTPDDMVDHPDKIFDLELTPEDLLHMSEDNEGMHTLYGITTVSQALINFFNSKSVISCVSNSMKYPCDSDTVAAISGGIAAAYYGRVEHIDKILEARTTKDIYPDTRFIMKRLAEL